MRKLSLILILFASLGILSAKSYFVKEFVSTINVNTDGSLDIEENMQYHFDEGPFRWVNRDVNAPRNGFIILEKAMQDGKLITQGKDAGKISVKKSDNLDVKFNLNNISNQVIKFTLNYKVLNAIKPDHKKAVLKWTPTPDNYNFLIKSGKITINFPSNIPAYDIISFLKEVDNVTYEEKGNSLICSFTNLKGKSFEIESVFPLEAMDLQIFPSPFEGPDLIEQFPHLEPYVKLYKSLIIGVILFLFYVIFILISRYNVQIKNLPKITALPSHKHPALVARLLQVGSDDLNLIPVLMHMAIKQLISFTQVTNKKGKKVKDYYIDIASDLTNTDDFDIGYLELIKKEEQRKNKRIKLKELIGNSYRHKKELLKLLNKKFEETGFVDVQKKKKYYKRIIFFFVVLVLGVVTTITGAIFFNKGYSLAPIPAFVIISYWIYMMLNLDDKSILSPSGLSKWKEWRAFRKYINKALQKKSELLNPSDAEELFPYILIMGYGEEFLHYFKKKNIELNFPNLGEVANDLQSLNTLISVVVVTSTASSASGGGSAGAGGGGAGAG